MKQHSISIFLLLFYLTLSAQENSSNWNKNLSGSLQINQAYTSNWSSGSGNSFATVGEINYQFNYQNGNKIWKNDFDGRIGFTSLSGNKRLFKNVDQFTFESRFSWQHKKNTSFTAFINITSQFTKGYHPDADADNDYMSNLFAPAFIVEGIGYNYHNEKIGFESYFTFLAAKHTLVLDSNLDPELFGLDKDKRTRTEAGLFIKVNYQKKVLKNAQIISKLHVFKNYKNQLNEIDIYGTLKFIITAENWLSMSLNLNLIYDNDTQISVYEDLDFDGDNEFSYASSKLQFQQSLGIGINFSF